MVKNVIQRISQLHSEECIYAFTRPNLLVYSVYLANSIRINSDTTLINPLKFYHFCLRYFYKISLRTAKTSTFKRVKCGSIEKKITAFYLYELRISNLQVQSTIMSHY